jgi:hypothetical protein
VLLAWHRHQAHHQRPTLYYVQRDNVQCTRTTDNDQ